MFTMGKSGALNYCTYVATFVVEPQHIVIAKGSKVKELIYAVGSTGEEQAMAQRDYLQKTIKKTRIDFSSLPDAITHLEDGQAAIGWEPLISGLAASRYHDVRLSRGYRMGIAVYAHNRWTEPGNLAQLAALMEWLGVGWYIVRSNPYEAALGLVTDRDLVDNFRNSFRTTDKFGLDPRI